jgi:hypothetical protein
MDKLKRIVSDRSWMHTSEPLKVLETRLKDMAKLEGAIILEKNMEDSVKNESKKQYMIMLVACYETYMREVFKIIIHKRLVPIEKIVNIKKVKEVKLTIGEVDYINHNKIDLSELIAEYINFQNFEDVFRVFLSIGLDEFMNGFFNSRCGVVPGPETIFKEKIPDGGDFVIEFFKQMSLHSNRLTKGEMIRKIKLLLQLRHKIVHLNIEISIVQEDILSITFAIYQFVTIIDAFLQHLLQQA